MYIGQTIGSTPAERMKQDMNRTKRSKYEKVMRLKTIHPHFMGCYEILPFAFQLNRIPSESTTQGKRIGEKSSNAVVLRAQDHLDLHPDKWEVEQSLISLATITLSLNSAAGGHTYVPRPVNPEIRSICKKAHEQINLRNKTNSEEPRQRSTKVTTRASVGKVPYISSQAAYPPQPNMLQRSSCLWSSGNIFPLSQ